MKKISDIEILRAVAIMMVLLAHSPHLLGWYWRELTVMNAHLFLGGGVDLFFAVSGFVITKSLQRDHDCFGFWARRIFRIIPAAWAWITITLLATVYFNRSGVFGTVHATEALAALLQVENFYYIACYGDHSCAPGGVPFGIYWSLSLEEQFYLLLPLALFLPRRALVVAFVVAVFVQVVSARSIAGFMLRTDALLLGVLIAFASETRWYARLDFVRSRAVGIPVFVAIVAALAGSTAAGERVIGAAALASAALVFIASQDRDCFVPRGLFGKALLWIGSRSYSLYLCHLIAYGATREIWSHLTHKADTTMNVRYVLTAVVLLVLFSEASYRWIEVPFRKMGRNFAFQGNAWLNHSIRQR